MPERENCGFNLPTLHRGIREWTAYGSGGGNGLGTEHDLPVGMNMRI